MSWKIQKPRVFIGSSREGHSIAEYIQLGLNEAVECTTWAQGVFDLSRSTAESLAQATTNFDFAVLVLTADDLTQRRGATRRSPRDNVVFEIGLFMGALGAQRTFVVMPRDRNVGIPSDLAGVTFATYASRQDGNLRAALGPVCTQLKEAIFSRQSPSRSLPDPASESRAGKIVARRRRRRSLGTAKIDSLDSPCRIVDISTSGVLLETDGEFSLGRLLDLSLQLDNGASARVTGQVVRVQLPDWGRVGGIAVNFTRMHGAAESVIEQYVGSDPVSTATA